MDAHNSFDAAQHLCIRWRSSGSTEGGKLSFDLPAKSVAVVTVN